MPDGSPPPPLEPQSELGAPPWAPLWNSCCSAARSRDPLGDFQKSFKAKIENLKIRQVFPSKFEPWRTFADPRPPKKGPLGPVPLSRGPPWKSLERKTHLSGPSLALPENLTGPILKKHCFLSKNAETTIFISSRAFRVKRQWSQNHVFHVLDPPWSPPGPEPFFSRPPRSLPKRTLELQGRPEILPRGPRSLQGPDQIYKVGMFKPS